MTDVISYFGTGAPSLRSEDAASGLVLAHIEGDEAQVTDALEAPHRAGTPATAAR